VGITPLIASNVPLINTILLISSGATVTYGHHALFLRNRSAAIIGIFLTIILAIIFTTLQGIEYDVAGFSIPDGAYGSCFYFSTGTHGIHVIVGTIFISVGLVRVFRYHFTSSHHIGFEAAILYWHFVDVV
jgi:cytochrome c oxidase subunit 3